MGVSCSVCDLEQHLSDGTVDAMVGGPAQFLVLAYAEKELKAGGMYKGQILVRTGVREGWGCFSYQSEGYENKYTGQWHMDACHGKGTFSDGESVYVGQWCNGEKHGHGEEKWIGDEVSYSGAYAEGTKHGHGHYKWSDGTFYDGQFSHDEMSGFGTHSDGEGVYTGQFEESVRHGVGSYQFEDGSKYEGQFSYGDRLGDGRLQWADGQIYTGQWLSDRRHGRGTMTDKQGTESDFLFLDGKKVEPGTLVGSRGNRKAARKSARVSIL